MDKGLRGKEGGDGAGGLELRIRASVDALAGLLGSVEAFAVEAELPPLVSSRLLLVVEELAVNTVTHGTQTRPPATEFRVWLQAGPSGVSVQAEDDGKAFDPTAPRSMGSEGSLAERQLGGAGLRILQRLASDLNYRRVRGRNRVTCRLPMPS